MPRHPKSHADVDPVAQEPSRLAELSRYCVLDTPPEQDLDDLTKLAALVCETPIAAISLVDEHRLWLKAKVGLEASEAPRAHSFCAHALDRQSLLVVPDAREDARFAENPLVTGTMGVRFYAGAPLITPEGATLGTLCVLDVVPRTLTPAQEEALGVLSRQVMTQFELARQHATALRESEKRLRLLTENAPVGLASCDRERRIVFANPTYAKTLGRTPAEIIGKRLPDVFGSAYETLVKPALDRAFAGERVQTLTQRPTPEGERDFELTAEPVITNGSVTQVIAVLNDVTARRKAELATLSLAAIVESSDDAIIGKNLDSIITSWNRGAEKIFGYTAKEMIGTSILRLIPEDLQGEEEFILATIRAGKSVEHFETTRRKNDGQLIEVSLTASPIRDTAGNIVGVSAVARDITARRKAEVEVRLFRELMEQSLDAIEIVDPETSAYLDVNEKGAAAHGYTRDEFLKLHVYDIEETLSAEKWPAMVAGIRAAVSLTVEGTHRRKDGTTFPVEVSARLVQADREYVVAVVRDVTQRKQVETALREREQQLDLYVRHSPVAVAMFDRKMRYLVVSNRWVTDYDLGERSVIGCSHYEIFPEVPKRWRVIHERCLAGAVAKNEGEAFERVDGTVQWIRWEVRPWHRADETVGGIIIFSEDITERKTIQQALEANRRFLSDLVEHNGSLIFVKSRNGHYELVNRRWEEVTGIERAAVIGRTDAELFPGGDGARFRAVDEQVLETGEYRTVEETLRVGDRILSFVSVKFPLRDEAGKVIGLCGMAAEITEQKRIEDRFRRLVDSAAQGVVFAKLTGAITGANDAFLRMVGYSRQDLEAGDLNWRSLTPPEYDQSTQRVLQTLATTGVCSPYEKEFIRKDGSRVPVLVGAAAFEDDPEEGVAFVIDLTERKKLEEQFLRAQRMESIGTLAGGIAHDLNNVLAPIMMSLAVLKMRFTDPASKELLSLISSSAERGADMVRQVLSFARGVEGRRIELQVRHLVEDIEKIVRDTFLKNITVSTSVPHDLWTVTGDPTQLHQVLLNLCVNARDAMPHGGTLRLSAQNVTFDSHYVALGADAKPGRYVRLLVEDSGTGMPPEVLEKIFDPFFTTKEVGKGTGLGLSTTMAIVKSHGGFIRVYSERGKGTTFKVHLPAQLETSDSVEAEPVPELPRGNGELILIVDDEAAVRKITQQTLETFGYRTLLANDGAEGVAIVAERSTEIAAILTDMTMPVMDGAAMIQVIQRLNPKIPIIAESGLSTNARIAQAAGSSVKQFLAKPFNAETLLTALARVIHEAS